MAPWGPQGPAESGRAGGDRVTDGFGILLFPRALQAVEPPMLTTSWVPHSSRPTMGCVCLHMCLPGSNLSSVKMGTMSVWLPNRWLNSTNTH